MDIYLNPTFKFELVFEQTLGIKMSESEASANTSGSRGPKGVVGLRNLGNTCYANSAIQALRQITEMTYLCLNDQSDLKKKHENHSGQLFEAYRDLLKTMWSAHNPAYVSPDAFWKDMLAAATQAGYEHFRGREPQDAHEFLMFLLDQIFEGTKEQVNFIIQRPAPRNDTEKRIQTALEAWKANFEKQYTPIVDVWFGLLEYKTQCKTCMNCTYRYETFNTLKVTVPQHIEEGKQPPTIQEMLKKEWEPETIEDYQCDTCKARTTVERSISIWRLPRCLVVVLKRFTPDGRKIHTNWTYQGDPINYTEFFSDASPERSRDFNFHVQSIVDHHGSARGGHYTAQGLSPLDGKWYLYDDENSNNIEKPFFGPSNYILLFRAQI